MTSTTKFNLFKPSGSDFVNPKLDVADQMDILDEELFGNHRYRVISSYTSPVAKSDGTAYGLPLGVKAYDTSSGGIFTGGPTGVYRDTESAPGYWQFLDTSILTNGWSGIATQSPYVVVTDVGATTRVHFRGRIQLNTLDVTNNNQTYTAINVAQSWLPSTVKYFELSCGRGSSNGPRIVRARLDSTSLQMVFMGSTSNVAGNAENYVDLSNLYYDLA